MLIKYIIDEDCINYKKWSMFIGFPHCSFKCNQGCEKNVCQNYYLENVDSVEVSAESIVSRYLANTITEAVVIGGLEPFDDFEDLLNLIKCFREKTQDIICIYSGYNEDEIYDKIEQLKKFDNIAVKFGRYVPNQQPHYDQVLGVNLVSDNQYAIRIS